LLVRHSPQAEALGGKDAGSREADPDECEKDQGNPLGEIKVGSSREQISCGRGQERPEIMTQGDRR